MSTRPNILVFRQDLRLADHAALTAATEGGAPVLCIHVHDEAAGGLWRPGGASRWWLHHSLVALDGALRQRGNRLVIRTGDETATILALAKETEAIAVHWSRRYAPAAVAVDAALKTALKERGIRAESHPGHLLAEPWEMRSGTGGPFRVFTPFWKALRARPTSPGPLLPAPARLRPPEPMPESLSVDALALLPRQPDWAGGLRDAWVPGEAAALARLCEFLDESLAAYADRRDHPGAEATSRLSPHLHFGEIAPARLWSATLAAAARHPGCDRAAEKFLSELAWRDFSHQLLFHNPDLPVAPLRPEFADFPWAADESLLRAWQRGRTGYPIVDAGMRALWSSGWMHNRVRMIAASFLVKHLLQPWQDGARWFWDTLVDADLANNAASWQWVAGCGADAAPYFRIFNPVLQGERFDADGAYVRRWLPELARLPAPFLHRPWTAPEAALTAAGIRLGEDYPRPIVAHDQARVRALAAFRSIRAET